MHSKFVCRTLLGTEMQSLYSIWLIGTITGVLVAATALYAQTDTTAVLSGKLPPESYYLPASHGLSPMLRSLVRWDRSLPARLRLLGVQIPTTDSDTLRLRFAVLDSSGNALAGLDGAGYRWEVCTRLDENTTYCSDAAIAYHTDIWVTVKLRLAVIWENSLLSLPYRAVITEALDTLRALLGPYDSLALISAGVQPTTVLPMTWQPALPTLSRIANEHSAFAALNRLTYGIVSTLETLSPSVMIVITSCDDHASLDVVASDVIEKAIQKGTRVYCIAIGENLETIPLEIIAAHTGGGFYRLYTTTRSELMDVLVEIIRSEQVSSSATVSLSATVQPAIARGCTLYFYARQHGSMLSDSLAIPAHSSLNPPRQIVALFSEHSSVLDSTYRPILNTLADILAANPAQSIELIGHAFREGKPSEMISLSIKRVRTVKSALVALGINPNRIRLRAMGELKPIYPTAQSPTELAANRRVELRWLDPALLPYELIAGYTYSEHEAITLLNQWEQRGYRAYIEDVLIEGRAGLRIKLWGYPSREDAVAAAHEIARRYRTTVTVE